MCRHLLTRVCGYVCTVAGPEDPGTPVPGTPDPASVLLVLGCPPVHGGGTLAACEGLPCTQGTPRGFLRKCELKCRRLSLARPVFTHTRSPCQSPAAFRPTPRLPSARLRRLRTPSPGPFTSWDLGRFSPKAGTGETGGLSPFAQEAALAAPCVFRSSAS